MDLSADQRTGRTGRLGRERQLTVNRLRSRLERVLDLARDAFVETDRDGVLTEWNRQAELLFGWSRDEVLGRSITEFLVPDRYRGRALHDLESARSAVNDMERTRPRQLRLLHREGYELDVSGSAYVVG
ncbi:MAG: PAS domain-containing protein, partial [Acidimicrobiales bacterium]